MSSATPKVHPRDMAEKVKTLIEELRQAGINYADVDKIRGDDGMLIDIHKYLEEAIQATSNAEDREGYAPRLLGYAMLIVIKAYGIREKEIK